jgi:hypothetical protein
MELRIDDMMAHLQRLKRHHGNARIAVAEGVRDCNRWPNDSFNIEVRVGKVYTDDGSAVKEKYVSLFAVGKDGL